MISEQSLLSVKLSSTHTSSIALCIRTITTGASTEPNHRAHCFSLLVSRITVWLHRQIRYERKYVNVGASEASEQGPCIALPLHVPISTTPPQSAAARTTKLTQPTYQCKTEETIREISRVARTHSFTLRWHSASFLHRRPLRFNSLCVTNEKKKTTHP